MHRTVFSGVRTFRRLAAALLAIGLASGQAGAAGRDLCFRGVNLSGAEYGDRDGKPGINYAYPSEKTIRYFARKGFDAVRLPMNWERLQPVLGDRLDPDELTRLRASVDSLRRQGFTVILDPHNFGYYGKARLDTKDLPITAFANFWTRLALEYANEDGVVFGLMNEPYDIGAKRWLAAANLAITGIRAAKARNLILVPGTRWSGATSWEQDFGEGSNAAVMLGVKDPANNFAYEVHQYLDQDFSGTHPQCVAAAQAEAALDRFTGWLRQHNQRGFLGELGVSASPECLAGLDRVFGKIAANSDVWLGWTYWAAGDWWSATEPLNIQPTADGDKKQLGVLLKLLAGRSTAAGACARIQSP